MKEFSFNINHIIKVKLTDSGKDILNKHFSKINKYCASLELGYTPTQYAEEYAEDIDGYIQFQLWDFMNIFGSYFMLGSPVLIQNNDIIFNEDALREVK